MSDLSRTLSNDFLVVTSHRKNLGIVGRAFAKFFMLALFTLLAPLAVYLDTNVLGHGLSEQSITEWTQEALLSASALLFFTLAWRMPGQRGFALLVGGFFGTMLIRELDGVFDQISQGFWIYPASAWAVTMISLALRHRHGLLTVMARAAGSRSFVYIILGLSVVLCFSRVFGTTALWLGVLGEGDVARTVKTVVQEGLELFGYVLIFTGTLSYLRLAMRDKGNLIGRLPAANTMPLVNVSNVNALLQELASKHQLEIPRAAEKELAIKLNALAHEQLHARKAA